MGSTLDYASREVRRPRRYWPDPRTWKILIGVLLSVVIVSATLFAVHRYRVHAASLTSLGGNQKSFPDGRDVQVVIAGNANNRTAAVLVLHYSTADPKRRVMKPGRVYSTSDPMEGLLSSWRVITHYPPDPEVSGVWVDGQRRQVSDRMFVIYVSDKLPATDIAVGEADQASFLNDARTLDPLLFVEKWIKPRLPSAE
jgi:hypothetical protein